MLVNDKCTLATIVTKSFPHFNGAKIMQNRNIQMKGTSNVRNALKASHGLILLKLIKEPTPEKSHTRVQSVVNAFPKWVIEVNIKDSTTEKSPFHVLNVRSDFSKRGVLKNTN